MLRKAAALKRFEYSPLGKELKHKITWQKNKKPISKTIQYL